MSIENPTLQEMLNILESNVEKIHWYNILTLHETFLEFTCEEVSWVVNCAKEESINEMPKYYAERIRVYYKLTSKFIERYKIE